MIFLAPILLQSELDTNGGLISRLAMIDVLVNPAFPADQQYVNIIELGNLPATNEQNYGHLNLGSGDQYLLATFETFDMVFGYTLCSFRQNFYKFDPTMCLENTSEAPYTLDVFKNLRAKCGDRIDDDKLQEKLNFLCTLDLHVFDWATLALYACGVIILLLVLISCGYVTYV